MRGESCSAWLHKSDGGTYEYRCRKVTLLPCVSSIGHRLGPQGPPPIEHRPLTKNIPRWESHSGGVLAHVT